VKNDRSDIVDCFLEISGSLYQPTMDHFFESTPLHIAVTYKSLKTIKLLLEKWKVDVNRMDKEGNLPIHYACQNGDDQTLKLLLEYGAFVDRFNFNGEYPLYLAAKEGHVKCVYLLLTQSIAGLFKYQPDGEALFSSYSYFAIAIKYEQVEVIQCILENESGIQRKVELLGGTYIPLLHEDMGNGCSAVHLLVYAVNERSAVKEESINFEKISAILDIFLKYGCDINALTPKNETALHLIYRCYINGDVKIRNNLIQLASILIKKGIDIYRRDKKGRIFIRTHSKTATSFETQIMPVVLETNQKLEDSWFQSPVESQDMKIEIQDQEHKAGEKNQWIIEIEKLARDVFPAIHQAVASNDIELIKCILIEDDNLLNQTTQDDLELSPLHLACFLGYLEVTKFLVDKEADIEQRTKQDKLPIQSAIYSDSAEIVDFLLWKKNLPNVHEMHIFIQFLLFEAAEVGSLKTIKLLREKWQANINESEDDQEYAITRAIKHNQIKLVNYFLENGVPVNKRNSTSDSFLHWAAAKGHLEIVELLIKKWKAVVNPINIDGDLPIHDACRNGNAKVTEFLLECGAWVDRPNYGGYYPLHLAAEEGSAECVRLLLKDTLAVIYRQSNDTLMMNNYLTIAIKNSKFEVVQNILKNEFYIQNKFELLVIEYVPLLQQKIESGWGPIHVLAYSASMPFLDLKKSSALLELLLSYGCDINAVSHKNQTALHVLYSRMNQIGKFQNFKDIGKYQNIIELAKLFISKKIDVSKKDDEGHLFIRNLIRKRHVLVAKAILPTLVEKNQKIEDWSIILPDFQKRNIQGPISSYLESLFDLTLNFFPEKFSDLISRISQRLEKMQMNSDFKSNIITLYKFGRAMMDGLLLLSYIPNNTNQKNLKLLAIGAKDHLSDKVKDKFITSVAELNLNEIDKITQIRYLKIINAILATPKKHFQQDAFYELVICYVKLLTENIDELKLDYSTFYYFTSQTRIISNLLKSHTDKLSVDTKSCLKNACQKMVNQLIIFADDNLETLLATDMITDVKNLYRSLCAVSSFVPRLLELCFNKFLWSDFSLEFSNKEVKKDTINMQDALSTREEVNKEDKSDTVIINKVSPSADSKRFNLFLTKINSSAFFSSVPSQTSDATFRLFDESTEMEDQNAVNLYAKRKYEEKNEGENQVKKFR
jgi:ankyrin repeat protein